MEKKDPRYQAYLHILQEELVLLSDAQSLLHWPTQQQQHEKPLDSFPGASMPESAEVF